MLLMLDRITGWWPTVGPVGQGAARGEMDVDPTAWFFKAHFFQDPVQPGSLGLEAMLQLLQFHMLQARMHQGIASPRFQAILPAPGEDRGGATIEWKYRGQVLPTVGRVTVTAEITAAGRDEEGPYARADASLWVDGRRIYHATGLGMRIVSSGTIASDLTFDPEAHPWVKDDCPTYVLPAMPLMGMADLMAEAVLRHFPGRVVTELRDVQAYRWLICDRPRRLRVEVEARGGEPVLEVRVRLLALDENGETDSGPRAVSIAEGSMVLDETWPEPPSSRRHS